MSSRQVLKETRIYKPNKAEKTGKSFCVNKGVVCTIPKFGGDAPFNSGSKKIVSKGFSGARVK